MKYTTSKLVNAIVFGILFAGFVTLGIYFGVFVAPDYIGATAWPAQYLVKSYPYNFAMEFGVLGYAAAIPSCIGLVKSIRVLMGKGNDRDVEICFLFYSVILFVIAIFALANAVIFYRLIPGKDPASGVVAFWIIVFVIIFIACLVGASVPLGKYVSEKDDYTSQKIVAGVGADLSVSYLLVNLATLIFTSANASTIGNVGGYLVRLGWLNGLVGISAILFVLAYVFIGKAKKANKPVHLCVSLSWSVAIMPIGGAFLCEGIMDYLSRNAASGSRFCLNGIGGDYAGLDWFVMCIIVASLLILIGLIFAIANIVESKKKPSKTK